MEPVTLSRSGGEALRQDRQVPVSELGSDRFDEVLH
jgi:hypothetical protein